MCSTGAGRDDDGSGGGDCAGGADGRDRSWAWAAPVSEGEMSRVSSHGVFSIDAINTLAVAGVVLFLGYAIRARVALLSRLNIPAPVVGGLLMSAVMTVGYARGRIPFVFDTTWQSPLMIAFFTSVGFGASVGLLKRGGPLVLLFFAISAGFTVLQNGLGVLVATMLGQPPLLGVLAGSVTMAGGPATGLAFAPLFEQAGVPSAETVAVAAAMAGIVAGGLLGGPVGTWLIERRTTVPRRARGAAQMPLAQHVVEHAIGPAITAPPPQARIAKRTHWPRPPH